MIVFVYELNILPLFFFKKKKLPLKEAWCSNFQDSSGGLKYRITFKLNKKKYTHNFLYDINTYRVFFSQ